VNSEREQPPGSVPRSRIRFVLEPGEHVVFVAKGNTGFTTDVDLVRAGNSEVVVTDRRLLSSPLSRLSDGDVIGVRLDDVESVTFRSGLLLARVLLRAGAVTMKITSIEPDKAQRLVEEVRRRIAV
jgi:hypothetical protein